MSKFQNLLDTLDEEDAEPEHVETVNLIKRVDEIRPVPEKHELIVFDNEINLLNIPVRDNFHKPVLFENEIFTPPQSTTITMEGFIEGVMFKEQELITLLEPTMEIPIIKCNFARKVYPGYTEPVKIKKSNRGRKKREKKKKNRKKQGLGTEFNTQITFVVRPDDTSIGIIDDYHIVPVDCKVYKFKVFRTGKIQLPGVNPECIEEVIICARKITSMLVASNFPGVKEAKLVNINHVMKNYKFRVKMPLEQNIDLLNLKNVFLNEMLEPDPLAPQHPAVFDVKYTRQETKLAVKFSTPTLRKTDKKLKVNVFPSGKINILGAFADVDTILIYRYITWVFQQANILDDIPELEDNIDTPNITAEDLLLCELYLYGIKLPNEEQSTKIIELLSQGNYWDDDDVIV
jgi:hypothetical protein